MAGHERAPSNPFRAATALILFLILSTGLTVAWPFVYYTRRNESATLQLCASWARWSLRQYTRLVGVRVTISGPTPEPGSFIAPNHMGYADIFALGGRVPCFFVSKSEVATWPIIGHMFRQSRQIALSRTRSTTSFKQTLESIADRLRAGHSVCVFLEGTSSGGDSVLPFHASLLQPAIDAGAPIVPAAIRWRSNDQRIDVTEDVAYWKDHVFAPHLFRLMGLRGVEGEIRFGSPLDTAALSRNEVAQRLHDEVVRLHGALRAEA